MIITVLFVLGIALKVTALKWTSGVVLGLFMLFFINCCIREQTCYHRRRSIKPNYQSLEQSLQNRYKFIPSELELETIEMNAFENLKSSMEAINEEMEMESDIFLSGSVAERYSVPVLSTWMQTEGITNDSHAMLSDFDFMVSPKEEKVSFLKDVEIYHANQTTFIHERLGS